MESKVILGDALQKLKTFDDNVFDSIVSDPPSGISFMGKHWDTFKEKTKDSQIADSQKARKPFIAFIEEVFAEALRTLKPGGYALVWALPRTSHWTTTGLENAGFEIRDVITHHFGSGFPKSHNISKAIDKLKGVEPKVVGKSNQGAGNKPNGNSFDDDNYEWEKEIDITEPTTPEAKQWDGWGTALKPASEHWILCRKPLSENSIADNVLKHGVGGINIDACRIPLAEPTPTGSGHMMYKNNAFNPKTTTRQPRKDGIWGKKSGFKSETNNVAECDPNGRFPANLILSHYPGCNEVCVDGCPVKELDEQSGVIKSGLMKAGTVRQMSENPNVNTYAWHNPDTVLNDTYGDIGGASRFFYVPKPSRYERNKGCRALPPAKENLQGLDTRGRTLEREDGSKTLVERWIPKGSTKMYKLNESVSEADLAKIKEVLKTL